MTIAAESGEALRDCPGYLRFWTAATVSGFGSYVTSLAIGVLIVLNLHGGSMQVGLVNAARWLPYMLFGLVAGVLVDRARRRPLLVVTDLGRGILLLAVPVLAMTHQLNVVALMALMATFGLMSLVNDAAFQSFAARDKDDHVNAKSVQPPTRALSGFPLDKSCAGDPRRERQVCPDGVKVSGKLTADCRQGCGGQVADVMRTLGRL